MLLVTAFTYLHETHDAKKAAEAQQEDDVHSQAAASVGDPQDNDLYSTSSSSESSSHRLPWGLRWSLFKVSRVQIKGGLQSLIKHLSLQHCPLLPHAARHRPVTSNFQYLTRHCVEYRRKDQLLSFCKNQQRSLDCCLLPGRELSWTWAATSTTTGNADSRSTQNVSLWM